MRNSEFFHATRKKAVHCVTVLLTWILWRLVWSRLGDYSFWRSRRGYDRNGTVFPDDFASIQAGSCCPVGAGEQFVEYVCRQSRCDPQGCWVPECQSALLCRPIKAPQLKAQCCEQLLMSDKAQPESRDCRGWEEPQSHRVQPLPRHRRSHRLACSWA